MSHESDLGHVWALCKGEVHEGGQPIAIYATERIAFTALHSAAEALRSRWVQNYEDNWWAKNNQTLDQFLNEQWEDGGTLYICACDYVAIREFPIRSDAQLPPL